MYELLKYYTFQDRQTLERGPTAAHGQIFLAGANTFFNKMYFHSIFSIKKTAAPCIQVHKVTFYFFPDPI